MLKNPISITAISSISPLGNTPKEIQESYDSAEHLFRKCTIGEEEVWMGQLSKASKEEIKKLRRSEPKYKHLDDAVIYALYASRKAVQEAGWTDSDDFGINIGSSRGATSLFEKYHQDFLENGTTATLSSPTTTLGNISSWVAHDLKTKGPEISHSITCSTALHAMLNGVAWIQSGMTDKFLVGGSEAPLTPFTIAQMQALKIYTNGLDGTGSYPCRALDMEKTKNTMVLGEGASIACLESGNLPKALAKITGVGYATEPLTHNVSLSTDAICFQESMNKAMQAIKPEAIDAIIMHAPGTKKGDLSEYEAIKKVFCNKIPFLTTNKWKVGHTFGASGMLSVEMAILMLRNQKLISAPFYENTAHPNEVKNVLVNAVGFGGNAVTILLSL
ncbi:beta-ketoacyl synthase N-terminal-like domain-containing protein [uncultured Croceitalea sp.]|uniref:beta-ketoacyl synthase N-terminal-like domain-containing protein n=1 Tax=uncultured Croceitalea sp. TaxID=1798908 RepID=UPI00330617D2